MRNSSQRKTFEQAPSTASCGLLKRHPAQALRAVIRFLSRLPRLTGKGNIRVLVHASTRLLIMDYLRLTSIVPPLRVTAISASTFELKVWVVPSVRRTTYDSAGCPLLLPQAQAMGIAPFIGDVTPLNTE